RSRSGSRARAPARGTPDARSCFPGLLSRRAPPPAGTGPGSATRPATARYPAGPPPAHAGRDAGLTRSSPSAAQRRFAGAGPPAEGPAAAASARGRASAGAGYHPLVWDAVLGVDFGLSVTAAVLVRGGEVARHAALLRPGPASPEVLRRALEALELTPRDVAALAVTGGRSRELAGEPGVVVVDEPTAIGRGALALAGVERALAVSCGTGTAMVAADAPAGRFVHVTGTPVGGGTLEGLGAALLGVSL